MVEYPDEVKTRYDRTIYEVARIPDGDKVGNFHIPLTVDGYRAIYKGYLADPDLQDARARWPFVAIWDNHEFSWQGWQSIVQGRRPFERPGQSIKVAANQAWFEYLPARVARSRADSLERFDPPAVKNVAIEKFDENGLGDRAEQPDRDQQPHRLPRAALRQAPRPDHHRPAQLSQRGPVQRSVARKARRRRVHRHVPRGRRCRFSTAAAPSTAAIRPPKSAFNDAHVPNPQKDAPPQTILGAEQKAWFKDQLKQLDGDVEDLGQLAGRARLARRPAEPARRA